MKTEYIIITAFGMGIIFILLFIVIVSINQQYDQLVVSCYQNNFQEDMELHGDYSGTFDCMEYYGNVYGNGEWTKKCSTNPFSSKMSCHDLCNIDCAYQNKISGEICVC